jgi:hypothetical protein
MSTSEYISELIEVYVPIMFPGSSQVVGVVETYKMPTQVIASIRRGQLTVAGTATCGGLLLYLCLFWIVRRAARRLDQQHRDLAHRTSARKPELRATQAKLLEAELQPSARWSAVAASGTRGPISRCGSGGEPDCGDCGFVRRQEISPTSCPR